MLHITNGATAAENIRLAGMPGDILQWLDPLQEGPVPGALNAEALRNLRAEYYAQLNYFPKHEGRRMFMERDAAVERYRAGEYALWFESDLYDQLQILQILDALNRLDVEPEKVMLFCIAEQAELRGLVGVGQLAPREFAERFEQRIPLRRETLRLAKSAWFAFVDSTPETMRSLDLGPARQLPYLAEAFQRLWRQYPSRANGLSLLELRILQALDKGFRYASQVLMRVNLQEERPFLDDYLCWHIIAGLQTIQHPLLEFEDRDAASSFSARKLRITPIGREVLAGEKDHITLNGIDRWIGGVHLESDKPVWRFSDDTEAFTQA
jgi:hypothetical protein